MIAPPIEWGEDFARLTDRDIALAHMDRLARRLNQMERDSKELQLEYWRWQAKAYPVYECHHPDTHFCKNCFEEARGPRD